MPTLSLSGIRKSLGGQPILRGIDLEVRDGEFVVLVGPSGCGKSTLLRTIAGLELPDGGTIKIGTRDVTQLAPRDRDIGMVFQSYALYPHMTVRENLAFGLTLKKTDGSTIATRIDEVAAMLGLEKLLDRRPRDMSGGQRQRVAMGRAIARRPSLFLFDEPLSNLDAALRAEVRLEIKRLHARLGATMIYVTHDQVEAMTLADRLVVLKGGHVEQVGPPLEVYARPATRFVGGFLGSPTMNVLDATIDGDRIKAAGVDIGVPAGTTTSTRDVALGLRAHDLVAPRDDLGSIELVVEVVEAMGFESFAHGKIGDAPFVARLDAHAALPKPGERLRFGVEPSAIHLFDRATEKALA